MPSDSLPVYQITHDLRLLIASRCETTLTWDQLRSPQVSQFLLKPILQNIHETHLSKAVLYALMVNCLQFSKDAKSKPGISGASRTRAMVCELLAIKLLKEYSTRNLIDALSYDFYPLQGQAPPSSDSTLRGLGWDGSQQNYHFLKDVRISCLEIAIRAQAKRFLAHPLVVQQLEGIWAGTIVFRSPVDSLHRQPGWKIQRHLGHSYGSINTRELRYNNKAKDSVSGADTGTSLFRRTVSLYNPRDASLFKLSRLRVPRYRQVLSTLSFAIMLGLFLTMLQKRPLELTALEVIFWFWSAGFMLDEIVGFNEQGFSLYLMSFWNTFDVGILVLLICYYCLRLYSVLIPEPARDEAANLAFDVLAANAVLLLPRLFSILDHYRYFSQLLIAFRMMVADLVAVLILIIIACSGFFVAFTFSFGGRDSPSSIAYALFQMFMGFTPAGWQLWDHYNPLGKAILVLFLFICHFLVVTILITVLTNSFMAIVQNAHEEHQFVFAVNTISMVKSDDLFAYVAPANVLAWAITPLRYVMPFRGFLKLNRTVIKITHMPILFSIYLYERTALRSAVVEPTDLVDRNSNAVQTWIERHNHLEPFTQRNRVREPSIATHQKNEALDQVFRRPLNTHRKILRSRAKRQSSTVVNDWMQNIGAESATLPPEEQDRKVVDALESGRLRSRRPPKRKSQKPSELRHFTGTTRSFASDPEDFAAGHSLGSDFRRGTRNSYLNHHPVVHMQTDIEGDDELSSGENNDDDNTIGHDKDEPIRACRRLQSIVRESDTESEDPATRTPLRTSRPSTAKLISRRNSPSRGPKTPPRHHYRNPSTSTILYNPVQQDFTEESTRGAARQSPKNPKAKNTVASPSRQNQRNNPAALPPVATRVQNILPAKADAVSLPGDKGYHPISRINNRRRRHSSLILGLGSDLGDNKAVGGGFVGGVPGSFATQMAYAMAGMPNSTTTNDNRDMLTKLVLARMTTLEEGFREVVKEVKVLRHDGERKIKSRPTTARRASKLHSTRDVGFYPLHIGGHGTSETEDDLLPESSALDEDDDSDFKASSV